MHLDSKFTVMVIYFHFKTMNSIFQPHIFWWLFWWVLPLILGNQISPILFNFISENLLMKVIIVGGKHLAIILRSLSHPGEIQHKSPEWICTWLGYHLTTEISVTLTYLIILYFARKVHWWKLNSAKVIK